jgi:hypothetical protein
MALLLMGSALRRIADAFFTGSPAVRRAYAGATCTVAGVGAQGVRTHRLGYWRRGGSQQLVALVGSAHASGQKFRAPTPNAHIKRGQWHDSSRRGEQAERAALQKVGLLRILLSVARCTERAGTRQGVSQLGLPSRRWQCGGTRPRCGAPSHLAGRRRPARHTSQLRGPAGTQVSTSGMRCLLSGAARQGRLHCH